MKNDSHSLEMLESRIAPSTLHLVNPTTAAYTDADGDAVTVKFTKAILSAADLTNVLVTVPAGVGDQLQTIDLTAAGLAAPAGGTGIAVTAVLASGGDGLVNVGFIKATGLDLGGVTIHGDLGALKAGDATSSTAGVKSLTLQSFGVMGMTTGATDLESDILGALGSLKVAGDMKDAYLVVTGAGSNFAAGKLGSISIGGSLIGGTRDESGGFNISGALGNVSVGQDVIGGTGTQSGTILSDGGMGSVTIGGSIIGSPTAVGMQFNGGRLQTVGDMGMVKIGRDLLGGAPEGSGALIVEGKLAGLSIGGSIIGSASYTATISAHAMGPVSIGGDVQGRGAHSGVIEADGHLASLTIAGSLLGGAGEASGQIVVDHHFDLGPVAIGGHVLGGDGNSSGSIFSGGKIASITVTGSVTGGAGPYGAAFGSSGDMGLVKIGGDLAGGSADHSGFIGVDDGSGRGKLAGLFIAGSLVGGGNTLAGAIQSGRISGAVGAISIGFNDSGFIDSATISSLNVGGSLQFGAGVATVSDLGMVKVGLNIDSGAAVDPQGKLKSLTVGGSVAGSVSASAIGPVKIALDLNGGAIGTNGKIDSVTIGGSVVGGSVSGGSLGVVTIGRDVIGGVDSFGIGTGIIQGLGSIAGISIGGSLIGGSYSGRGTLSDSGDILGGSIKSVFIAGDLVGGDVSGSGSSDGAGAIEASHIDKMVIGGSVRPGLDASSGRLTHSGAINVDNDLGSLTINGSLLGRPDTGNGASPVIISAQGQAIHGKTTDLAIGSLTVLGQVQNANILAGYSRFLAAANGDAQIGAVKVGGNWTASNLVAGAMNSASSNTSFGDANDASIGAGRATIVASIASIVIGGQVFGTAAAADHFGFVSEFVGSFSAAGILFPLTPGAHNDNRPLGATSDVSIHEI